MLEPIDILHGFPGWTTEFEPRARQERSTTARGRIITKNLGSPLWTLSAVSKVLRPGGLDEWRAKLEALVVTQQLIEGYALSKVWPRAYPRGSWPQGSGFVGTNAVLAAVAADRKTVRISGLPPGFVLSVGDLVQIGAGDLHRVRQGATATAGTTTDFELFPALWPGVVAGAAVSLARPHCLMAIVPGSLSSQADAQTGRGAVSFQAIEARE